MVMFILSFLITFGLHADEVAIESQIYSLTDPPTSENSCLIEQGDESGEIVDLSMILIETIEEIFPQKAPLALGAEKTLSIYFQSCLPLSTPIDRYTTDLVGVSDDSSIDNEKGFSGGNIRKISDQEAYVNSHIILKKLKSDPTYPKPPFCKDMTKTPPVYGYASRVAYNKSKNEIDIFNKGRGVTTTSADAVSVDCSGFVSTALAAAGLKSRTNSNTYTSQTTRTLANDLESEKSCLKNEIISPDSSIKAGNIINVAGSHTVIIDSVGVDPLGIDRFSESNSCDDISTRDFDFTYIHSGTTNNSYGPIRVNANIHWGGSMWNNIRAVAVELCKRKAEGLSAEVKLSEIEGIDTRLSLIKHESDRIECVSTKPAKIIGEECVQECLEKSEETI